MPPVRHSYEHAFQRELAKAMEDPKKAELLSNDMEGPLRDYFKEVQLTGSL